MSQPECFMRFPRHLHRFYSGHHLGFLKGYKNRLCILHKQLKSTSASQARVGEKSARKLIHLIFSLLPFLWSPWGGNLDWKAGEEGGGWIRGTIDQRTVAELCRPAALLSTLPSTGDAVNCCFADCWVDNLNLSFSITKDDFIRTFLRIMASKSRAYWLIRLINVREIGVNFSPVQNPTTKFYFSIWYQEVSIIFKLLHSVFPLGSKLR